MPYLIAQGPGPNHRWRKRIPKDVTIRLGRDAGCWSVRWDDHISRQHVDLRWVNNRLHVESLARSSNPVFYRGEAVQRFCLQPGEHFVIGATTFLLAATTPSVMLTSNAPAASQTLSTKTLRSLPFRDPGRRLELLSRLPELLTSAQQETVFDRIVQVTLEGIRGASTAILCRRDPTTRDIEFLAWDERHAHAGTLLASRRLIAAGLDQGESVIHTWQPGLHATMVTARDENHWAFCTPFKGSACQDWALYVAGEVDDGKPVRPEDVLEEMKFAEVVATTVGSFFEVRELQKRQSTLSQFFSPPVVAALAESNAEAALTPREVDVTVLFCDLRGFSGEAERSADDLMGLLRRVSDALGILTREILNQGGVIGDFHGDAAMGFWGWPLAQEDAAERAACAALAIRKAFQGVTDGSDHPLSNFQIGLGIASGRAVAGKIGTRDQVKITAFGPAVNLSARLESLTKQVNVPILIDKVTARRMAGRDDLRCRRLASVRPYGLRQAIDVYELLPGESEYPALTNAHIASYEAALAAFQAGDWIHAWEELHKVPASDTSKDLLTTYIASRNRVVPANWEGVIELQSK